MLREIELLMDDYMNRYQIPGVSIAVSRHGVLIDAAGYGFANVELRVPATAETVYQLASIGKQFTSALLMLLAERGSIDIDAEISTLPSEFAVVNARRGIAGRHLLTHTSGTSDEAFDKLNLRLDYTDDERASLPARGADLRPGRRRF